MLLLVMKLLANCFKELDIASDNRIN